MSKLIEPKLKNSGAHHKGHFPNSLQIVTKDTARATTRGTMRNTTGDTTRDTTRDTTGDTKRTTARDTTRENAWNNTRGARRNGGVLAPQRIS